MADVLLVETEPFGGRLVEFPQPLADAAHRLDVDEVVLAAAGHIERLGRDAVEAGRDVERGHEPLDARPVREPLGVLVGPGRDLRHVPPEVGRAGNRGDDADARLPPSQDQRQARAHGEAADADPLRVGFRALGKVVEEVRNVQRRVRDGRLVDEDAVLLAEIGKVRPVEDALDGPLAVEVKVRGDDEEPLGREFLRPGLHDLLAPLEPVHQQHEGQAGRALRVDGDGGDGRPRLASAKEEPLPDEVAGDLGALEDLGLCGRNATGQTEHRHQEDERPHEHLLRGRRLGGAGRVRGRQKHCRPPPRRRQRPCRIARVSRGG